MINYAINRLKTVND